MREQIVERKSFSMEERKTILNKSNGRCAHCGVKLDARSGDFTVEHIVPISKGGTHDEDNLVALCFSCNQEKSNYVLNPSVYYKYVKEEHLPEIMRKYQYYQKDTFWFQRNNFFPEDAFEIRVPFSAKNKTQMIPIGVFKKATLDDMEEVYDFVSKYHDKFNIGKEDLREVLDRCFKTGAVYTISNANGIIAIFPVVTEKGTIWSEQERDVYYINICGLPCVYQKYNYGTAIYIALRKLIQGLCEASSNNEAVLEVMIPENDNFIKDVVDALNPEYETDPIDGFESRLYFKTLDEEGKVKRISDIRDDPKRFKIMDKFSKFLQRSLKLKDLTGESRPNMRKPERWEKVRKKTS